MDYFLSNFMVSIVLLCVLYYIILWIIFRYIKREKESVFPHLLVSAEVIWRILVKVVHNVFCCKL